MNFKLWLEFEQVDIGNWDTDNEACNIHVDLPDGRHYGIHCADSHINGYVRFKLTLTEDKPVIKPYIEEKWAELVEAKTDDIQPSLFLIKGLHQRWFNLLETISKDQWELYYIHPEDNKETNLKSAVCMLGIANTT